MPANNTPPRAHPRPQPLPASSLRASFRHPVSPAGFIDAAWWPRGRDLATELPPLIKNLWELGREINRVTYNTTVWNPAPRKLAIGTRIVRLGGFATSDPLTITLTDAWGAERIDMLVIAPDTDPEVAKRALTLAGQRDGRLRAAAILHDANATGDDDA